MRKITQEDLTRIIGTSCAGYTIEQARVKAGSYSDSDHYGIAYGVREDVIDSPTPYATWEFNFRDGDVPDFYWGRYHEDKNSALRDYEVRD